MTIIDRAHLAGVVEERIAGELARWALKDDGDPLDPERQVSIMRDDAEVMRVPWSSGYSTLLGERRRAASRVAVDSVLEAVERTVTFSNGLTLAQAERLAMLLEEKAESIQVIGKILRHGYASTHPNGGLNNRELLEDELTDEAAVLDAMRRAGDLGAVLGGFGGPTVRERWQQKLRYTHHQNGSPKEPA